MNRVSQAKNIKAFKANGCAKPSLTGEIENSFLEIRSVIHDMDEDRMTETDPISRMILSKYSADLLRITVETLQLMRKAEASSEDQNDGNY